MPPKKYDDVSVEPVTVNQGVEETWDELLSEIMESQFKIHNIDSNSHIISLKISGNPQKYIDCGSKTIKSTSGSLATVINTAPKYSYTVHRLNHNDVHSIQNQLKGKIILFVSGDQRRSTIKIRTTLELITNRNITTTQGSRFSKNIRYKLALNGNERRVFEPFGMQCQSTGKIGKKIEQLMRPIKMNGPNSF